MFQRVDMNRSLLASLLPLALALLTVSPSRGQEKKLATKQLEVDLGAGIKMKLVRIEAGKFMMGSRKSEQDYLFQQLRESDGYALAQEKRHEVEITKAFYMGVYAVTQAEYEKLMGENPSHFCRRGKGKEDVAGIDTARLPVEQVSWEDAMEYCHRLSKKTGKTFDLPTEAEWEFACRAGNTGAFHFGDSGSSKHANFGGGAPYIRGEISPFLGRTARVGSYAPNAFGLFDMHGNVSQWCKDRYDQDYYGVSPPRDPQGAANGLAPRVVRGGGWNSIARECRSAYRGYSPGDPHKGIGFRVVMRFP